MKRRTPSWRHATPALAALTAATAIAACGASSAAKSDTTASTNTAVEYSECIRAHGVPDFPDPSLGRSEVSVIADSPHYKANGKFLSESPAQVDSAMSKCEKYSAYQSVPIYTDAQMARIRAAALVYARCMRAHGIDYPDPGVTRGPGGRGFAVGLPGQELRAHPLDVRSPAYQSANRTCGRSFAQAIPSGQKQG